VPRYINNFSHPVYFDQTVFIPNQEVETLDVIDNRAFVMSSLNETFLIGAGNQDLLIRFNNETAWTTVTLTNGAAVTAAQIIADINTAYGATVASDQGGYIRLEAPYNNTSCAVYIATTGSTAAATLGFTNSDVNPIDLVAMQVYRFNTLVETYNITTANNTFIFKLNADADWTTVTLTTGVARTAAQIAAEINLAYETTNANANKVAFAEEPVVGAGFHIKLLAPLYNNFESKIYIKSTGNTALAVLGFTGDNFTPIVSSLYPSLSRTNVLPLYNPIISETPIVFPAAGTYYYYLTDPDRCRELSFFRIQGGGGLLLRCYIEELANTPPFTLTTNEILTINLSSVRISRIIIVANVNADLTIRERIG
jgi:hypothetical protein